MDNTQHGWNVRCREIVVVPRGLVCMGMILGFLMTSLARSVLYNQHVKDIWKWTGKVSFHTMLWFMSGMPQVITPLRIHF